MINKLRTVLLFFILSISLLAQTEVSSTIKNVKVFKQNAQITRNLSINSVKGMQQIVLSGISTNIKPSSLQVSFNDASAMLVSAKYENNFLVSKINNSTVKELEEKLEILEDKEAILVDRKNSLLGMQEILNKNQDLGTGNASFTADQVIQLTNAYQTKYLEIRNDLRLLNNEEEPLLEKIENISKQLLEASSKDNLPTGNIILQISSKSSANLNIECKYIVQNAGWNPIYDIRSEGIEKNVNLNYKANIYQNTGVDWENVNVSISTGNPARNNNRPILSPLYATIYQNQNHMMDKEITTSNMMAEVSSINESQKGYNQPSEVEENQLSVDFDIVNKQTIYSDNREVLVGLNSFELTTEYIYHSVPKLNKSAYLLAKISDWSQYNLVSGNANIFFEGSFVGTTQINSNTTSDKLLISLGIDNNIVVDRLPIKEYTSSKFIGSNTKEKIGYELFVKNKKSVPIKIEILDQIPVSQNKDIEVSLDEKGNAVYNAESGKLLWILNIEPRIAIKERFIYTVKYPKKDAVIGIK